MFVATQVANQQCGHSQIGGVGGVTVWMILCVQLQKFGEDVPLDLEEAPPGDHRFGQTVLFGSRVVQEAVDLAATAVAKCEGERERVLPATEHDERDSLQRRWRSLTMSFMRYRSGCLVVTWGRDDFEEVGVGEVDTVPIEEFGHRVRPERLPPAQLVGIRQWRHLNRWTAEGLPVAERLNDCQGAHQATSC